MVIKLNIIKQKKIESLLVREISNIIMMESDDSFLKGVTITSAKVSSDLSFAKIYFTTIYDNDPKSDEKELEEASLFIRKMLARSVELRHTPKLRFIYDNSIEYGNNIEKIIDNLHKKEEK